MTAAMPLTNATSPDRRALMVLLLAICGGGVDAVMILRFQVLTAAQTGNTVLLAVAFAQGRFAAGLLSAVSLAGYIIGSAVGELIIVGRRGAVPAGTAVGRTLVAETITLGSLLILWQLAGPNPTQGTIDVLIALAATAMGMQSATALRLDAGPTTTYVTGMLTAFIIEVIRRLRLVDSAPASSSTRQGRRSGNSFLGGGPWLSGVTWTAYGVGAFVSGLLLLRVRELALLLPIAAVLTVAIAEARCQRT